MGADVFISYIRADQTATDWRGRLQMYLAQSRQDGGIDAWDDQRIAAGENWRTEIRAVTDDPPEGTGVRSSLPCPD
jgi:hypothetical protein